MKEPFAIRYGEAVRILAHEAGKFGGIQAAQSNERWRGKAHMVAQIYEEHLYMVLDDVRRIEKRKREGKR